MSTSTPPAIGRLSPDECWALLDGEHLGRLGLPGQDTTPEMIPVNFVASEGGIYFRTAFDSKLFHITSNPIAAFEADGEDEATRWSVLIRGTAARVRDDAEIARSGALHLATGSPREKPYVVKLTADIVTGRRFPRTDTAGG
jgi:nitroimidazol reductase NimA-like FMN-containing flavoprotein (pyridoxamine 5'-phosphate oxidase superfamily)